MSRFLTRVAALTTVIAVVGMLPALSASALPGSGGGGGSSGSGEGGTIVATVTYSTGGGGSSGCQWQRVDGQLGAGPEGAATFPYTNPQGVTFNLWRKTCSTGETWYVIPETDPEDLLPVLLEQVKETALPSPEPTFLALDPVHN